MTEKPDWTEYAIDPQKRILDGLSPEDADVVIREGLRIRNFHVYQEADGSILYTFNDRPPKPWRTPE